MALRVPRLIRSTDKGGSLAMLKCMRHRAYIARDTDPREGWGDTSLWLGVLLQQPNGSIVLLTGTYGLRRC